MTDPKGAGASGSGQGQDTFFRKEGEYWSIAYHDTVVRLRDVKGLRYIAHLLHHPGIRFASRELLRAVELEHGEVERTEERPFGADTTSATVPPPESDEQARLAVTKRIKAVVKRLERQHPLLAYHLSVTVKTGAYCVYLPDPARPIDWTS